MPASSPTLTIADAATVIREAGFGVRPPGIGLELEWFVTRDGVAVTDVRTIRSAVETNGPLPHGSRVTFEPGGQIEISAPPSADGPSAIRGAERDAREVMVRLADAGMSAALQPKLLVFTSSALPEVGATGESERM